MGAKNGAPTGALGDLTTRTARGSDPPTVYVSVFGSAREYLESDFPEGKTARTDKP